MPTLTETFDLWKAECRAWRMAVGHGPQNDKLARYYEVRAIALGALCNAIFKTEPSSEN